VPRVNFWGAVIFLGVGLALLGGLHFYLWWRLVRDTTTSRRWRWLGAGVAAGLALLLIANPMIEPAVIVHAGWLTAPGYVWVGVLFYLLLTLLAADLLLLLTWPVRRMLRRRRQRRAPTTASLVPVPAAAAARVGVGEDAPAVSTGETEPPADAPHDPDGPADPGRRLLLRRGVALAAGAVAVAATGYGIARAYGPLTVNRVPVPLTRLDRRADGLRIALISDLHVGPLYGADQVRRVVETVNGLDADLVALVGDLTSSEAGAVASHAAPLRQLRSRYGAYFVTGNHEYYTGVEEWLAEAEDLGLRVLRNERVEIAHRGGAIDLAGVNDQEGSRYDDPPDYDAALGDRDPSRPVVLLAHQPVQVHQAAAYGVDLQLSGHTHGGQLVPFNVMVRLDQPVVSGLATVDGTQLYVTNGAGFWGPPMRVGAPPEVTLIELRSD
jgi:predicted MPP superfamily phosphohydrolase